jgi:hypothetical protein
MDPELRELLEGHLRPMVPRCGQTAEQAIRGEATSLLYVARTFLDYDGPLGEAERDEIVELLRAATLRAQDQP